MSSRLECTVVDTVLANRMPESSGITTWDFMYLLFWLISYPPNVRKLEILHFINIHLFTLKVVITPIAGMTFFVWCIIKAKSVGLIVSRPSKLQLLGAELVHTCQSHVIH